MIVAMHSTSINTRESSMLYPPHPKAKSNHSHQSRNPAMATSLKTLIPPTAIALFIILAMTSSAQSQSDVTSFAFDFYGDQPTSLILQGDAHFPSDSTFLRLTQTDTGSNPLPSSVGRAVYSEPVLFRQPGRQADFETTVKFMVRPRANSNNPADGLVFFMSPVGFPIPRDAHGGNLGIFSESGNSTSVFAVEFDIFINGEWDPNFRHVGIDIESRVSRVVAQIPDSFIGKEVTLRVNYVGATRMISAVATAGGSERVELSYEFDLSTILPEQVQVGLAASTGEYVAVHDVVAWYFTSTLLNQKAHGRKEGPYIRQCV